MTPLVFKLRDIPETGLDLEVELERPLVESAFEGVPGLDLAHTTARVLARVTREQRDNVFVRGQLSGVVTLACSRCAEQARLELDAPLELSLLPQRAAGRGGEAPVIDSAEDDLEVAFYQGDQIDLAEVIREQLVLALPIAPLCREDCKGLCPSCGTNWNQGTCGCPPLHPVSPFSALKSLKT